MGVEARQHMDREASRLAALESYDVLDTPRERDFDDIAQLAADICGTPIGVVNLIADRRQFFKAEVGIGVRETPFDSSFCAKAICEEDFLLVSDATKDARFVCNPMVTGTPHLRFYAGALLKTADGHVIGTVCVLDFEPRVLNDIQQRTLRVLARQVMAQLELRKLLASQHRQIAVQQRLNSRRAAAAAKLEAENEQIRLDEERLRLAQHAGGIGIFEVDLKTDEVEVSEEFCRIFGLPDQRIFPASELETLVIPEDEAIPSKVETRGFGTAKLDVDYRIRRQGDQALRWIARRARFARNAAGQATAMLGVVMDITESKQRDVRNAALYAMGDHLRNVDTVAEACRLATDTLAQALSVARVGYATLNHGTGMFSVEIDRTARNVMSLEGRHPVAGLSATMSRLVAGETIAVANVSTTDWLAADAPVYAATGVRAFLNVPILEHGRLMGVLFAQDNKPRFWTKAEMDFTWGVADRTYAALGKIAAENQQQVLNHELSHRLKNTLAVVQAIASQTLRKVTERDAVDAFISRLHALGAAHDILLQQSWSSARLRAVIEKILSIHAESHRFEISGLDLPLGPKAGLSLSLILHELATNALKHGALSAPAGVVRISWEVASDAKQEWLTLTWREAGGPVVTEPARKGFGSRLIQMGIAGTGNVDKRYDPMGLVAIFRAPMPLISEVGQ